MSEKHEDLRRISPSTGRNKEPILRVLEKHVRPGARVLEIASGAGEHATFFASRLPVASWQPSDPDADARISIEAWRAHEKVAVVLPAIDLDVEKQPWPVKEADVILSINMIHISPWSACEALFSGAARITEPGALVITYGPYKRDGAHTAPTNEIFENNLRARNPAWGVRDLEAVEAVAARAGFAREDLVAMPANNFMIVFRKLNRAT